MKLTNNNEEFLIPTEWLEPTTNVDLENRVLIMNPMFFKDESKYVKFLLVHAFGGFACSPSAMGTAVFITFLADSETTRIRRDDVLWCIKKEFEEAAKKKLLNTDFKYISFER